MDFAQTKERLRYPGGAWRNTAPSMAEFSYPDRAFLGNGAQVKVVHGSPAQLTRRRMGPLRHAHSLERCYPHTPGSSRVYSRAESVHRFERLAGFEREGRCQKATTKPTYGRGCTTVAVSCKHSLSCGLQIRGAAQWMLNTCAISAQAGGGATGSFKYSDIKAIRFTWVPASGGSSGCSVWSSTTTGRSSFTTPVASTCSDSSACGRLTAGVHPRRKAVRPAPPLPNRRGNGRCATLPRQQRTRTRKQIRSTLAARAVA